MWQTHTICQNSNKIGSNHNVYYIEHQISAFSLNAGATMEGRLSWWIVEGSPHMRGQSVVPCGFAQAYLTLLRHVCVHSCPGKLPLYRPESCLLVTFPHVCSHSAVLGAQHQKSPSFFHMTALHVAGEGSRAHFPTTPYLSLSFLKNVERCFYSQMPWEISWFLDSCWVCPDVPIFVFYDIN